MTTSYFCNTLPPLETLVTDSLGWVSAAVKDEMHVEVTSHRALLSMTIVYGFVPTVVMGKSVAFFKINAQRRTDHTVAIVPKCVSFSKQY